MEQEPDKIDYAAFLQDALHDVVHRVLVQVAEYGLPGEHHLYLGFRTGDPGVQVPRALRLQYPEEVTIILQNQYWGLEVTPELFSVILAFGGSRQRITVPFSALTAFADPSADFGLRFDAEESTPEAKPAAKPAAKPKAPAAASPDRQPGEVIRFDPSRRR